jgi:hypothetical protein
MKELVMKSCLRPGAVDARPIDRTLIFRRWYGFALVLWLATLADAGAVPSVRAQDADTEQPPRGQVVIENQTDYPIDVIEYDAADGSYTPTAQLMQGDSLTETVGPGVIWFFRVNNEALIGQYTTTDASDQWLVLDERTLTDAGYPPPEDGDGAREIEEVESDVLATPAADVPVTEVPTPASNPQP